MLKKISLDLEVEGGRDFPSVHWGSLMHGVLMENIDSSYAERLHAERYSPVSQSIVPASRERGCSKARWDINILGNEAIEELAPKILGLSEVKLKKRGTTLKIGNINIPSSMSEEEFCRRHLVENDARRRLEIEFMTPCSHKSNGQYCIFPSEDRMIKSLVQKWNAYSQEYKIEDAEAVEQIIEHLRITQYKLSSTSFHLEGLKIPAFAGKISLSVKGPEPLVRLANMLLSFSEYSGIGMKTALGMGAVKLLNG